MAIVGGGSAGCVLAARLSETRASACCCSRRVRTTRPPRPSRRHRKRWLADRKPRLGVRSEQLTRRPGGRAPPRQAHRRLFVDQRLLRAAGFARRLRRVGGAREPGLVVDEMLPRSRRPSATSTTPRRTAWSRRPLPIRHYRGDEIGGTHAATPAAATAVGYRQVHIIKPWAVGAGMIPFTALDGVRMSTALTYLVEALFRPI